MQASLMFYLVPGYSKMYLKSHWSWNRSDTRTIRKYQYLSI